MQISQLSNAYRLFERGRDTGEFSDLPGTRVGPEQTDEFVCQEIFREMLIARQLQRSPLNTDSRPGQIRLATDAGTAQMSLQGDPESGGSLQTFAVTPMMSYHWYHGCSSDGAARAVGVAERADGEAAYGFVFDSQDGASSYQTIGDVQLLAQDRTFARVQELLITTPLERAARECLQAWAEVQRSTIPGKNSGN